MKKTLVSAGIAIALLLSPPTVADDGLRSLALPLLFCGGYLAAIGARPDIALAPAGVRSEDVKPFMTRMMEPSPDKYLLIGGLVLAVGGVSLLPTQSTPPRPDTHLAIIINIPKGVFLRVNNRYTEVRDGEAEFSYTPNQSFLLEARQGNEPLIRPTQFSFPESNETQRQVDFHLFAAQFPGNSELDFRSTAAE